MVVFLPHHSGTERVPDPARVHSHGYSAGHHPATFTHANPAGDSTAAAHAAPTPTPVPVGPWIIVPKNLQETSVKPAFTITLNYPQITGTSDPHLLAFNQAAEKLALDTRDSFKKDFLAIPPDPNFGGSFAEMKYSVMNGSDGLLSVLFTISFYASGAAHPNQYSQVLNFDLVHGKKLELANLFLPTVDYLKVIAAACSADLTQQKRLEFPEGVLPKAENFASWNISGKGLMFSFDPYQVGPYAMGPSQVVIPLCFPQRISGPERFLSALIEIGNRVERI